MFPLIQRRPPTYFFFLAGFVLATGFFFAGAFLAAAFFFLAAGFLAAGFLAAFFLVAHLIAIYFPPFSPGISFINSFYILSEFFRPLRLFHFSKGDEYFIFYQFIFDCESLPV